MTDLSMLNQSFYTLRHFTKMHDLMVPKRVIIELESREEQFEFERVLLRGLDRHYTAFEFTEPSRVDKMRICGVAVELRVSHDRQ